MWLARQVDAKQLHVFPSEEAAEEYAEDNPGACWVIWFADNEGEQV
jgi:hypothetical protein